MDTILQRAIRIAYSRALERATTAEQTRIKRALAIALDNRVRLYTGEHYAMVLSDSGKQWYTVRWDTQAKTGECNCVDHNTKAPNKRCKHRYAVWLIRKALKIMQESYYIDPINGVTCGNVLLSEMQRVSDGNIIDKICNR